MINEIFILSDISNGKEWCRKYYKSNKAFQKEFNRRKGFMIKYPEHYTHNTRRLEGYYSSINNALKLIQEYDSSTLQI